MDQIKELVEKATYFCTEEEQIEALPDLLNKYAPEKIFVNWINSNQAVISKNVLQIFSENNIQLDHQYILFENIKYGYYKIQDYFYLLDNYEYDPPKVMNEISKYPRTISDLFCEYYLRKNIYCREMMIICSRWNRDKVNSFQKEIDLMISWTYDCDIINDELIYTMVINSICPYIYSYDHLSDICKDDYSINTYQYPLIYMIGNVKDIDLDILSTMITNNSQGIDDVSVMIIKKKFKLDNESTKELCKQITIKGSKNDEEFPVNINGIHFRRMIGLTMRSLGVSFDDMIDRVLNDKIKRNILITEGIITRLDCYMRFIGISLDELYDEINSKDLL